MNLAAMDVIALVIFLGVIVLATVVGAQEMAAAVGADKGQVVQTVEAVEPAVELGKLSFGSTTVGTGAEFGHSKIPPKCKIGLRGSPGGLRSYNIYLEDGKNRKVNTSVFYKRVPKDTCLSRWFLYHTIPFIETPYIGHRWPAYHRRKWLVCHKALFS